MNDCFLIKGDIEVKTPYQIAVENGFMGTEEEFNYSLANIPVAMTAEQLQEILMN